MTELIIGCLPADNETNRAYARSISLLLAHDMFWLRPYPGSVEGTCGECGGKIWIGPKQQQTIRDNPGCKVLCLFDATIALGGPTDGTAVMSLSDKKTGRASDN